ncbi:Bcr/CflA family drug resistance efflux transporter [Corynebacterium sp. HMSC062E11]|uniref:multidrug effflux MFS transporter n=1 Tax=unclassified Corynebacterium TaxID=2624378 RepID=UPI0008A20420|nr:MULTISPECIES: multidrug effflux MFS transporter [unclassified Corynebacterium]MDK6806611.1 multidrug effflux MFS transporter [Corynebacterium aurimucosum]NJJ82438.1 multidrug effflux MFS transporter [Corynebacterium aurimucosum]OFK26465.1 Bcr/CflA family drug resistance efflux transporter [Corynebacterium sp. HMSC062E11]OFL58737.1 Bcr/CflA family drug resistance efflux transporter [Corynebacterium sp. HMSC065D07]OFP73095.1 Bcr/CflA family drug resistance efflux transporter [Corynebacterium 
MIPFPLLATLALLSATAPFATDMYLPVMPEILADLGTTRAMVQLTISGFFIGMGVGQLVMGPLSDAIGRKRLLIAGACLALVASVLAALAPTATVLVAARVLQGLGGGACVVLARAVVPDLVHGAAAAKAYSLLMALQGIAPAVAPVLGGVLAEPLGWRGIFWVLAGLHAVQLVLAIAIVPETAGGRSRAGLFRTVAGNYWAVLTNARVWGYLVTMAFGFCSMFCYIAASAFVVQDQWGFSPLGYSLVFGINSVGLFMATLVNSRAMDSVSPAVMLRIGVCGVLACGVFLLLAVLLGAPVWACLLVLFACVAPTGFIMGNATALATGLMRPRAGSVSAIMGFGQSLLASAISPLMGWGSNAALTMATGMVCCSFISLCGLVVSTRLARGAA